MAIVTYAITRQGGYNVNSQVSRTSGGDTTNPTSTSPIVLAFDDSVGLTKLDLDQALERFEKFVQEFRPADVAL